MKLFRFEEDFITILTKCAWWVECTYNKGVIWLAFVFTIVISYIGAILLNISSYDKTIINSNDFETWVMIFIIILPLVITFLMFCFLLTFLFFSNEVMLHNQLFRNIKKSPNPNKYTSWIKVCRFSIICPFICGAIQGFGVMQFFCAVYMIIAVTPSLYLFCVDSIPPGYKKKKHEEKEIVSLTPLTQV